MKRRIKGKLCDTDSAKLIGAVCSGEYGDPAGYEEKLFMTRTKQYFVYGLGGSESKHIKESIKLITDEEAAAWKKENIPAN